MSLLERRIKHHTRYFLSFIAVLILILVFASVLLSRKQTSKNPALNGTEAAIASICSDDATATPFTASEGVNATFPCLPRRDVESVSTPIGNISVVHYRSIVGAVHYEVIVADYGTVFSGELNDILRGIVLSQTKSSTMEEFGISEKSSKAITMTANTNTFQGEFITADSGTQSALIKIYMVGKKLFRAVVLAPTSDVSNDTKKATYMAFLDSFLITASQ